MEGENVPCPTRKQDGNLCGCPLFPQFNLCPICGVQVDQTLFKTEEHLNSDGDTSSSIKSESGNPVTQSEDLPSNRCTETTDRNENEQAEKSKVDKIENQVKDTKAKEDNNAEGLESEGRGGERKEGGDNGNRKRKKEEEDKGGGSKSKEIKKESGKDTDEKVDIKDKEHEKTREIIGEKKETMGGRNEKEGTKDDGLGGGTEQYAKASEKDRKCDGDGNNTEKNKEKKDDEVERKKRDLENGKLEDGDCQQKEGQGIDSDPLLRSSAEEASSTKDMVVSQEHTSQNQNPGQKAQTSDVTGKHSGSSKENQTKKTVRVSFHAFLAPTVNVNPKNDELYVVFGPKRDDWNPQKEGLMKFTGTKKNKKDKNGIPVLAEVELEKDLLKNDGLSYRYCFFRKGNKSPENEFLFRNYYPYHNGYRKLTVPAGLDSYQQFDGFIYAKKGGFVVNFFKDTLGMSNSNMIEVMKKDGIYALKQYLPNICGVLKNPNQDPSTIITKMTEYTEVFQGGVKDHFLIHRQKVGHGIWQEFVMEDHLRNAIEALDSQENKMDENGRLLKALMIIKLLEDLKFHMDVLLLRTVEILHHSLLLLPDTENNQCSQLDFLETSLEPSMRENIRRCLITFLKASARKTEFPMERNPSWIMCLPIVHFLGGSLHPFAELDYAKFEDKTKEWWLVRDFEQEKEELKTHKWLRPPSELMKWMKPIFKLDTKAQRSFMACLKLDDLDMVMSEENILIEIKLATLHHYFEICFLQEMDKLQNCIKTVFGILKEQLMQLSVVSKRDWNEVNDKFKIQEAKCMAILSTGITKRMRDKRTLVSLFHSHMLSLAVLETLSKESDDVKSLLQRSILILDEFIFELGRDFSIYDFALSILNCIEKNELSVEFERKCLKYAREKFETMGTHLRLEFFSKSAEEFQNESLKNMMQEVVMENISEILQDPFSYTILSDGFWYLDSNTELLSKLFSQLWNMNLNASTELSDNEIIYRALSSSIYPKCVEAFILEKVVIAGMDQSARRYLSRSVTLMGLLFQNLLRNTVEIEMLELITAKKDTFLAVAQVFEKYKETSLPLTSSALKNIVLCREKDLKRLQEVKTTVQKLQFFFKEISENSRIRIMEVDERTLENWRSLKIGEVCAIPEESGGFAEYQPNVILFIDLLSKLDFIVKNMFCYNESKTFHTIMKNTAKLHRRSADFQFADVIDAILIPTTDTWDEICIKMKTGSISVREIEKYCFNDFNDDELYDELVSMNRGRKENWIKDRITQLQRFRMFSKTVSVAKLFLRVRDEFDIDGSFENLELIAQSDTKKDISLVDLKMSIEKFNQKLEKITENQKKSIASFTKAKSLVQWMRSALPGGIKDLKIYADLALLSVEGDEHVGRVTHLHSAAIGYSSVIFGDINGEVKMINTWKEVWQNLEKDESLPKKLEESNRVLNWFIEIKEAHGSVEVTSLKQVDAIKDRGIFKVGNSGKAVKNSHQLDLQDVIWLHVPAARFATNDRLEVVREDSNSEQSNSEDEREENGRSLTCLKVEKIELEGEGRDYTLGEMTDLQSRLMLVTGKADAGRESIERFTSIFDNVTRLGKVFLQLQTSGCILFKSWTFEFHCNPNAGSSVMIRTHEHSVVKGTNFLQHDEDSQNAYSNVNEYIRKIADFMESCYEEWIDYIAGKRKVFYPLNFYTVDQMVLLQEEIAKYRNGNQVTQFLGPLLSVVKFHCSLNPDLDDAINKVQENLLAREQTSEMENESEKNTHTDAIREFLQVAEGTGISRKHALRAIQSQEFDIADTDAGLIWCMSNDEKDDEEEYIQDNTSEINTSAAKDTTFGDKLKEFMEELEENMRQQEVAQVILNLDVTWKKFLSCASSSATDFLSIEHLGMILDILYKGENCILKRTLIDPLKCGKPNLIVCPQSEVIPMVLTIYMIDPNIPLPSRNEVLLCTDHTTKEEVDIFFRRALFQSEGDQNERIFCLMNADKLQYDASEQSLKDVTEYIKSASGDYKLVIICSSENEYKSPMISALDKYRAPKIAVAGVEKIKEYLKKKYTPENVFDSAADVDSIGHCVRVVRSEKAGMGKSLHKKRLTEKLQTKNPIGAVEDFPLSVTIPLSQKQIDVVEVSSRILKCTLPNDVLYPRIFHIDIAYGVERYVDSMLFNMLILGSLIDESGYIFHRSETDLYIVETTLPNDKDQESEFESSVQLLNILPSVRCISPEEVLRDNNDSGNDVHVVGFDEKNFQSDEYQRPYHYLMHYENRVGDIPVFNRNIKETDKKQCLQVLTRHCCVENPSWAELRNFIHFLNTQLQDFEKSVYCSAILQQDLPGFPVFVLRFLIQMSKDFSTRSLDISEGREYTDIRIVAENDDESSVSMEDESHYSETDEDIKQFQMRRKWETSAHPYLFFNPDQNTITFIGFNIDRYSRNLVDQQTRMILERDIMSKQLWGALRANNVPLQENFDDLSREQKIERLCRVVGNDFPQDPDETYELTTDNVKKMMAIYMRFRCNIPVIVMGETGCGKTCLIKFLCSLQCPAGVPMNTMTLMKVHGGTTKKHIIEKVKQAESLAESNCREHGKHIITVLFFDEANTTEAVGCIKEIMCDGTIDGQPLALNTNLKLVAACNPYRKHSDEMIDRLERAGLGYHVNSDETDDKLGRIPMRHLVYRVQPLPQSMLPLVWDFGQLDSNVEKLYIIQMVQRCVRNGTLPPVNRRIISILSDILAASQEFMRNQKDECSFVSLRDVERTLKVFGWMYNQTEIFDAMDDVELEEQDDEEDMIQPAASRSQDAKMTKALLLALGVCYHSSLKSREEYREYITDYFASPLELSRGAEEMKREITRCQMAFLQNLKLNDNIAKNLALRENFFMMVVCVELRIPLFLVGKPGSSKSLSKTILDHNMQGRDSDSSLFKSLKQVQLISFQCSPLATADGILKTFNQASSFQKSKDLEKFVSVVVLDEVGLAEDSPRMPLKALHPLLEDGCPDDEEYEDYKKVSFIGISNWALDPAKMNRGILVQREVPDEQDLIESARGICEHDDVYLLIEDLIPRLAQAYLHVFNKACNSDTLFRNNDDVPLENLLKAREFFGLRDFYSLVKMICAVAVENRRSPTPHEVIIAIKRNFGGLEGLDPVQEFGKFLPFILQERPENRGVKTDTALLRECLHYEENKKESRYILLLTENYGALNLLHQLMGNEENTHVIFGSSFPRDQEYIEICRNINRIKVFMETGKTVVLLNLENLYESLYDALNQYYMESGPDRYIDLGLGTHRVKCKVDKKFRLVVVAEKRVVYREFPIPLINRMEKHFLTVEGMLTDVQLRLSHKLEQWAREFSSVADSETIRIEEVFIGYNKDTAAGVVLKAWEICSKNSMEENDSLQHRVLEAAKHILLWGCTPDAVLRLNKTEQEIFAKQYMQVYFKDQCHESLCDFLQFRKKHDGFGGNFIQITTHSKLMSETDKQVIERKLPFLSGKVSLLSLQAFDTEQQFSNQIREISQKGKELLLIQCDTGDENSSLVECARYCVQRELQTNELDLYVIFLVHLSRVSKSFFSGFQTGRWTSVHIDELRLTSLPCIQDLMTKSISAILQESLCSEVNFSEEAEYESAMVANLQERHVNLRTVLFNCIHPALASITEVDDNQERSIKRIKFIFKELNKSNQLTEGRFGYCLIKHIVTILSKHSADSILYNESWIQSEAAMSTSVNKTGTLRASCQRIIEDRVTPLLAKIVAFVDTNNNLSILESSDREVQWLTDLWLGIFSSIDVEILIKIKVPQVMNTGANHLASATFPFSWLIYEAVEQFLLVTSENAIEKSAEELFQETEIGHFVLEHLAIENLKEATRLYMSDFVKMSHKASCSREEMIVCEFLHVCFEEYMAGKEDNFTSRVFCIHKTFRNIKPKLEIFSEVMCFVPQGDGSFYQKVESDIKELDITAVKYLLEVMEPNETSIDTPDGQHQWIENVQKYRPVIERLLHADYDKTSARGRLMLAIRSRWTKIVVLKLFIQNLCINTTREKLMAQTCKILWKIMGDNSNFKEKPSLEKLEKFLKASNLKAMTEFLGKFGKCVSCDKHFDSSPPVLLPCGHRICREECFSIIVQTTDAEKLCPVNRCSQSIPENFDENETPEKQKEQMKLFNDYQERCNKFYMQVVSQLCFENSTPPSDEVMRHLLQLVIHKKTIPQLNMTIIRTRQMTIFETVVDTTPVFRSFLLQLLIRTSEKAVFQHLEEFLRETDTVLQVQNKNHEIELCLLLMQCFEDSLVEQAANLNQDREKEATFVRELLSTVIENLENCTAVIEKLRNVATARYCLQTTAKYLKECYSVKPESNGSVYEEIFQLTTVLCDLSINHIRIYLLTHICRSYGLDLYQLLLKSNVQWLFPTEGRVNERMQECPDYCVVLGNTYKEIRDDVAKLLLVKNNRLSLKITERSASVQIFYLLALLKEIKVRELFCDVEPLPKQFVEALKKEFARKNLQTVQKYLDNVLGDSFAHFCKQLQIQYHRDIRGQGIVILLLHFLLVLKTLPSNELLQPLVLLATNPISLKDSFLPTMPEEVLSGEIKTELQRMEEIANKVHHTVTWYRCPNGHPYAVGDCGNPTQVGQCYHCKAQIGGESRIRDDNAKDTGADFSKPGHILGSAEGRSTQAISERTLSPSSNILLRLLTHMAMLIGANEHSDDVYQLIQPAIPTFTVSDFLWAHLNKDIDTLQVSLDRSLDDIFMFLHSTIHSFLEEDTSYAGITRRVTVLNQYDWFSKEGRSAWETAIDRKFLSRLLQERQELFEKCEEILSNDRSMGSDPILRTVFKKVVDSGSGFSTSNLQSSPHVWQHRTKVTFEHFVQEFYVMKNNELFRNPYFVLEKFLQQECHLRHLRHIPNILQMLRVLITKYGKQITREETETMTLQDCVNQFRNDPAQKIVAAGFTSFCEVWNALRYMLISIFDANDEMKRFLGRDISIESTNIRAVLPDIRGVGACSRILLEFLIGKQNEFVTACGQSIDPRFSIEKTVTMKSVTAMQLISFNREADIFPVIIANCNYTYMQEESTKLEYDFENIQAVLQDQFLFGKPLIDTIKEFPLMSYKADTSVSMKFNTLVTKILQEALNKAVQSQIAEEFADLPELYVTIGNIDVVVNFLLSVHASGEILLNSFMVETLQMKTLPSSKASQCCKLSHVQSLWFLLFHEKTKRLHYSEKEAFDSMNSSIQESLPENSVLELDSYLNELSMEKLEILLEQLMECIIFSLNCGEGDIVSFQYSLSESLMVHLENPVYREVDLKTFGREDVEKIPDSILTLHAVEVWKKIHRTVRSRK